MEQTPPNVALWLDKHGKVYDTSITEQDETDFRAHYGEVASQSGGEILFFTSCMARSNVGTILKGLADPESGTLPELRGYLGGLARAFYERGKRDAGTKVETK